MDGDRELSGDDTTSLACWWSCNFLFDDARELLVLFVDSSSEGGMELLWSSRGHEVVSRGFWERGLEWTRFWKGEDSCELGAETAIVSAPCCVVLRTGVVNNEFMMAIRAYHREPEKPRVNRATREDIG